ncbi:unnamed protein product [Blepharisma stoltei]|uniref:Peptidase M14 domain-containing protein n=1 Tax=Blepharisma stoltei TaxID=1481888 RepID=A0AAU9JU66_9CILI|nr:unnamed protein product [Blepharisma stoltei]
MKITVWVLTALKVLALWNDTVSTGSLGGYFTYNEIQNDMISLVSEFPNLVSSGTVGSTYKGEEIKYLKIELAEGLAQEERTGIMITAAQFAGYPIGPSQVMYIAKALANTYKDDINEEFILSVSTVWLIPVINVDAYMLMETEYSTNKNFPVNLKNLNMTGCATTGEGGVNLDRNWGFDWNSGHSSHNPCDSAYNGYKSFSESETLALKNFVESKHISVWIHYDRSEDACITPYTSSGKSKFTGPAKHFFKGLQKSLPKTTTFGSIKEVYGDKEDGTLIDYAYSEGIIAFEIGINHTKTPSLSIFDKYYDSAMYSMERANYCLNLEVKTIEFYCDDGPYSCDSKNSSSYIIYQINVENSGLYDTESLKVSFVSNNAETSEYKISPTKLIKLEDGKKISYNMTVIAANATYISVEADFEVSSSEIANFSLIVEKEKVKGAKSSVLINYQVSVINEKVPVYDHVSQSLTISYKVVNPDDGGDDDNSNKKGIAIGIGLGFGVVLIIIVIGVIFYCKKNRKGQDLKQPNNQEIPNSLPQFEFDKGRELNVPPKRFSPASLEDSRV